MMSHRPGSAAGKPGMPPPLVPDGLRTTVGGLWAVADRATRAFGSPRVDNWWWRVPAAAGQWCAVLVYRRGIAASRHAHVQVAAVRGTRGTRWGITPRGWAAAVAVVAAAAALLGIVISVVLLALTRLGVNGYVAYGAGMLAVVAFLVPLGSELRCIKTQGAGRGGRLGDGARRVREEGHRGPVAIASNFGAHPQKHGHGNEVMRAWLAHADAHRIAVVADARDEGLAKAYIKHYGFRFAESTDDRLVVRLPAQAREDV